MAAPRTDSRNSLITDNAALKLYYKHQQVCPEAEVPAMWAAFLEDLPVTFRLTCSGDFAKATEKYYNEEAVIYAEQPGAAEASSEADEKENLEVLDRPDKLSLIPKAYRMNGIDRRSIRKNVSAKKFRARLISDTDRGALQRQELVSMIPPLFLQVNENDRVLDLCAAPGSKTTQMIDACHRRMNHNGVFELPAKAAILANDVAIERARLLSHQLGKVASPLVATICADALGFPKSMSESTLYTKILCDVPCTGDGTLRKNPEIWREWSIKTAVSLHDRQLKILTRGIELLAPGGRLVYSTCSLNPLEDEAVVSAALAKFKDELDLLDVFSDIPELPALRGKDSWLVPDTFAWLRFADDTELAHRLTATSHNKTKKRKLLKTITPLNPEHLAEQVAKTRKEAEECELFCTSLESSHNPDLLQPTMFSSNYPPEILEQMKKTARFLPHHQLNSGGFYCALFQRKIDSQAPIKKRGRRPAESSNLVDGEQTAPAESKNTRKMYDDLVKPRPASAKLAQELIEFYGLRSTCSPCDHRDNGLVQDTAALPKSSDAAKSRIRSTEDLFELPHDCEAENSTECCLYTNGECERRVFLASPMLYEMHQSAKNLDFISMGSKVFELMDERFRKTSATDYRITNDGAVWLLGYMRRRVVCCTTQAMIDCLSRDGLTRPYLLSLEASGAVWNLDSCRREGLLETGGCVLITDEEFGLMRVACLITASGNILPLLKKCLRPGLLDLLGCDNAQE